MTYIRPCIDLHHGQVKQIVGGSLDGGHGLKTNFVSEHNAAWFAQKYCQDGLFGGHVIKLGPGNDEAAKRALAAFPNGLQIGGGIDAQNAKSWLEAGASHVIVTSWIFDDNGKFCPEKLQEIVAEIGKARLVIDLSCRKKNDGWIVAMNRWQTMTSVEITNENLDLLANSCAEFLIHAADVEGLCRGIDESLVVQLSSWAKMTQFPITYAGGIASMADIEKIQSLSSGLIDVTVGSALDLFGGTGVAYNEMLAWNQKSGK